MIRVHRSCGHRLRDLVRQTGDGKIATRLGVPRSTAAGWLRRTELSIVVAEPLSIRENQFQAEVVRLRRRVQGLRAVLRLLVALQRVVGIELDWRRLPDGEAKSTLLCAIQRAQTALRLRHVLRILGVSASLYLFGSGLLRRVLAMTEIQFSNSMIEAWWRALEQNWLPLVSIKDAFRARLLPTS